MSLPTTRNIVLGSGRVFFDKFDSQGRPTGELYMAETPGFELTVTPESIEIMSDDGPVAESLVNVTKSVSRNFALTTKNVTDESLALFLIGTAASQSTVVGNVVDQAINNGVGVKPGHWYQLGVTAGQPTGVRGISTVVIKEGAATKTVGTDYVLDADLGRIYVVSGGSIAEGDIITASYAKTAVSWTEVTSNDLGAAKGALRYVADNTAGANRDLYVPSCVLEPNGTAAFKSRDTAQTLGFTVKVQKPSDGRASVYINGRAA